MIMKTKQDHHDYDLVSWIMVWANSSFLGILLLPKIIHTALSISHPTRFMSFIFILTCPVEIYHQQILIIYDRLVGILVSMSDCHTRGLGFDSQQGQDF